ncbi:unnamed protein product, partial [Pylaiella littoralis]
MHEAGVTLNPKARNPHKRVKKLRGQQYRQYKTIEDAFPFLCVATRITFSFRHCCCCSQRSRDKVLLQPGCCCSCLQFGNGSPKNCFSRVCSYSLPLPLDVFQAGSNMADF